VRSSVLTVEEYDAAEQEAKIGLSFTEIMAFVPRTFEALGFPHRVKDERELIRYADWNRDAGNQEYFKPDHFFYGPSVRTVYTHDEVEAMDHVRDRAVEVTSALGRAVRPVCGPFAQLGLFRILMALGRQCGRRLWVFEVGPGTGYLGALLLDQLWTYSFTDNAQALFLWQSRLLLGKANGVSWWDFVRGKNPTVDVVVSNSNLGEMTNDALKITLRNAQNMLEQSSLGLFLFTSMGLQQHNTRNDVHQEFLNLGFKQVCSHLFQGYVIGALPGGHGLDRNIPLFDPSGRGGAMSGAEACHLPSDQHPLDLAVTKLLEDWEPPVV
jgi:hypothetical protein